MSVEKDLAKHLLALQRRIGAQQLRVAIPASLAVDVGKPSMRALKQGVVALTCDELHFMRKQRGGDVHVSVPVTSIGEVFDAIGKLTSTESVPVLMIGYGSGSWALFASDESREMLRTQLSALHASNPDGSSAGRSDARLPPATASPAAVARRGHRRPSLIGVFAGLLIAAGTVGAIVVDRQDGTGAPQADAFSAGQPQDDILAQEDAAVEADPSVDRDADPDGVWRYERPDGFVVFGPSEEWDIKAAGSKNDGRQVLYRMTGPDGAVIRLVHTPGDRAAPNPEHVVDRSPLAAQVDEAELVVLENFPTDECRQRRCDDYVLNDPAFGGLAILASDSDGVASQAAEKVALTLRAE